MKLIVYSTPLGLTLETWRRSPGGNMEIVQRMIVPQDLVESFSIQLPQHLSDDMIAERFEIGEA